MEIHIQSYFPLPAWLFVSSQHSQAMEYLFVLQLRKLDEDISSVLRTYQRSYCSHIVHALRWLVVAPKQRSWCDGHFEAVLHVQVSRDSRDNDVILGNLD